MTLRPALPIAVAGLAALLAGCGDRSKDPGPCRRAARELTTLLSTMNHEPAAFFADGAKLVERGGAPMVRPAYAPVVHVRRGTVLVEGRETSDPDELRGALQEMQAHRRYARGDDTLVHVVVDEDATWDEVAPVAAELHAAGVTRPAFGFRYPSEPVQPPPRSKVDDQLDAIERSDDSATKATRFAKVAEKVVAPCGAMIDAFGSVAVDDGTTRADALIAQLEPALVKCHCNLDLPSFRSLMFRVLYVPEATTSVQVTLAPEGKRVTAPASMPWREAHARLVHGETVWLAVE